MDLVEFRDFCLSFDGVVEKTPFGKFAKRYESLLVFYISGHMFCIIDIDDFSSVTIRADKEQIEVLKDKYQSVSDPMNSGLRYWIQITLNGDMSDSMIFRLVEDSYEIIKRQYAPRSHE